MGFKVKKIPIVTALVLALSLCISFMVFASDVVDPVPYTLSIAGDSNGSYSFYSWTREKYCQLDYVNYYGGREYTFTVSFPNVDIPSGSRITMQYYARVDADLGTVGLSVDDTYGFYHTSTGEGNGVIRNCYEISGGQVSQDWFIFDVDYVVPSDASTFGFTTVLLVSNDSAYWQPQQLTSCTITLPDGRVVDAITGAEINIVGSINDGFSNLTGGWSDSGMSSSNNQLSGALGELDNMQQDADNDLHDAIADMTHPDLDEQSTGVSFMTSSISMLWNSLGGFQAVILCALALVVFNYVSRYRGS